MVTHQLLQVPGPHQEQQRTQVALEEVLHLRPALGWIIHNHSAGFLSPVKRAAQRAKSGLVYLPMLMHAAPAVMTGRVRSGNRSHRNSPRL